MRNEIMRIIAGVGILAVVLSSSVGCSQMISDESSQAELVVYTTSPDEEKEEEEAVSDEAETESAEEIIETEAKTETSEVIIETETEAETSEYEITVEETTEEGFTEYEESGSYVEYHFRNKKLLNQHFEKHGGEFKDDFGYSNTEEYEHGASDVINNPNALTKTESEDGDLIFYIESTNEFVVLSTDGYIRTYFRPNKGIDYFNRQ